MKKNLLSISATFAMIMAATTSCSKTEITPDTPFGVETSQISFRTSTGKTKANDNTIMQLQADARGFNVIAVGEGTINTGAYLPGFGAPDADKITYAFNQGWTWKNQAEKILKKWPASVTSTDKTENYPVRFFAAYPIRTDITKDVVTMPSTEAVITNLTLNSEDKNNVFHKGIAVALDSTKVSIDKLGALALVNEAPSTGMTDLTFKHIMSNMKFVLELPAGYKAYVQSVMIVNVNGQGRSYDYKTQTWGAEPTYSDATLASYAHFGTGSAPNSGQARVLVGVADKPQVIEGFSFSITPSTSGNDLMLMPQKAVNAWVVGAKTGAAANTFRSDAQKWKGACADPQVVSDVDITRWYQSEPTSNGMMGSQGWKGARIELSYILINDQGIAIVGRKAGIQGETKDKYVRVGFPLDIAMIGETSPGNGTGWEAGKRYIYNIPLGTMRATGGILLDPVYIDKDGGSTTDPIDNPKVNPGDPIVDPDRPIQFIVSVDGWDEIPGILTENTF